MYTQASRDAVWEMIQYNLFPHLWGYQQQRPRYLLSCSNQLISADVNVIRMSIRLQP